MNEIIENNYIPIPKIDLNKLHEQTDLYFNVNIFKSSTDLSDLLNNNSNDNILWNSINFLKFSFKNAIEINILEAYNKIISSTHETSDTTITLLEKSSGLLLNVFKPKNHSFISINVVILTNLSNNEYKYNLLRFDDNNNFRTLIGCNYYDTKLVKETSGDSSKDGFKDMSIIKSYWLPLNIDSYSNKSSIDKYNIINGDNKLKYVTTIDSSESNPTESDINSSIWLPYQIGLYYQMSNKYMDENTFLNNVMEYAPVRVLERFECRTVLNFTDDNYIFFNMMPNSRCIRVLKINDGEMETKYDYLDGAGIIKPLVDGDIILIQETKPNDISEVFFK